MAIDAMNEHGTQKAAPPPEVRRSFARRLLRLLALGAGGALLGVAGVVGAFAYHGRDLPPFQALTDYRPPQVSRVFDRNGVQVAEFFHERRTLVPIERIPLVLKQAVIAAEDSSFYEHKGLDYAGIARALLKDAAHFRLAQGASTITQQVVKNLVLSPERSVARKIKEAILARRIEQNLSKDEILYIYLNHMLFGHVRYGVEEASRFFFDKPVEKLTLGEAALLAGLLQSPAKLSPINHPDRAKARQTYVLRQMAENRFISRQEAEEEIERPIALAPRGFRSVGPYYAEEIRRTLVARYGEELVYEGGLRVEVGMDRHLQELCDAALKRGLEEVDRRFGLKPPALSVDAKVLAAARPRLEARERTVGTRRSGPRPELAWDFGHATAESLESPDGLVDVVDQEVLEPGAVVVAPVASVGEGEAIVDLGSRKGVIAFEQMKWARPYSVKWTEPPKKASDVLAAGQLARVRVLELPIPGPKAGDPPPVLLALAPVPQVQGALVAVDPATRHVLALAGGYDFALSAFNRATQAKRQPGSAFKPFVYAAALASGKFTTASIVNDAPELIRDPWTGKAWKPQNFEKDVYEGPLTLREALSKSKNTVSVRLVESIGPQAVIDLARRVGIDSPLPETMTLALGTAEVSPLELANAYATFTALGKRAAPILITRVVDASGQVLEAHLAAPEETLPPAVAYVTTSLMRSVVEMGTGVQAGELRRPVAGKTGTTSDSRDAWFSAFTPDLVATAWVGFDDHGSLGSSLTGGLAALPIWLEFMKGATEGRPRLEFPEPPGVEVVRIDPRSGLRAAEGAPGRQEVFVEGTSPTEVAVRPGEADPNMLFLEDGGGRRRP